MENLTFASIDEVNDISTLDEYQVALKDGLSPKEALKAVNRLSRDNARTPFQWDASENAGFTSGTPWLRINPNYTQINAAEQMSREDSVFNYYKKLTALRKNPQYADTIVYGNLEPVWEDRHNLMAFYRRGEDQTLLVIANYQKEPQTVTLDAPYKNVVLNNLKQLDTDGTTLHLAGYQAVILEM